MTELRESAPTKVTALTPYGERDEVQALAKRIMALHPAARAIGERGALLLAQLGVALGLNPLPGTGHIHAWVDKTGALCIHIGLEGRLALARQDSTYSFSTHPMRAEEVDLHSLKPGDRGAITELFRHDLTSEAVRLGLPVMPFIGIGIAYAVESFPKGRSLAWRAAQRSLKDAIRLAFSFSLPKGMPDVNFVESEGHVPADILDAEVQAEFSIGEEAVNEAAADGKQSGGEALAAENEARAAQRARDKAALYGEDESEAEYEAQAERAAPPSSSPATTKPTPEPVKEQAEPHFASSYKDVKIKTANWRNLQIEIAKELPRYANKNGQPEPIHMLSALAANGMKLIDDHTTAAELITELKLRHQEETSEPTKT